MAMDVQGQVGPSLVNDGSHSLFRLGKTAEQIVTELHGKYYESAYRGNLFVATQTAGVLMIVASGTTSSWSLYNPASSGKYLSLIRADLLITVTPGTPVIGGYVLTVNTNPVASPTTGTAVTPIPGIIGSTPAAVGRPLTSSTLPVAPTLYRTLGQKYTGAVTTIPQMAALGLDFDGTALLAPGCTISMHVHLNDTTNASGLGTWVWEEVPI